FPTPADDEALAAFAADYPDFALPEVVVVVAAYNEEKAIGPVLESMPTSTGGESPLPIATLVVVDGATDDTAAVARKHDVYVCELPRNRGQGAALRLGYAIARLGGAQYIVTTDADGQYGGEELQVLLEPLRSGEADLVIGSRRLGSDHSRDLV